MSICIEDRNNVVSEAIDIMRKNFFDENNMTRSIRIMISHSTIPESDMLTTSAALMLNEPISLGVSEQGLVPFRSDPTFVFPYDDMTDDQLEAVEGLLSIMESCADTQTCVHQTGQQYVLLIPRQNVHMSSIDVLLSFVILLRNTLRGSNYDTKSIMNVIIQRVSNVAFIGNETWGEVVKRLGTEWNKIIKLSF